MKVFALIISFFVLNISLNAQSDDWPVPEQKQKQLSPFAFEETNIQLGKKLFEANCVSCHGHPGKSDFIKMTPTPPDMVMNQVQINADGALHYKITEGKGPMPSFKNILSSNDIWNIIAYVRTFNPEYAQQVAKKIVEGTFDAKDLKILLTYMEDKSLIEATVSGVKDGNRIPLKNAEINLYAKRQFGKLVIDEPKRTNEDGIAVFQTPADLPGDKAGLIDYYANLPNADLYGTVETDTLIKAGVKIKPVSARAKRAMWNTVRMAPIWILITYTTVVLGVWSVIFFILFQLREVFLLGKEDADN